MGLEDAKCYPGILTQPTTVIVLESQMEATYWPASQPQWAGLALEPTYAMFLSPYSSCFLAVCTCTCLGTWGLYDWKWKTGAAWTRHTLCQPELLSKLPFVLKAHGWSLWIP